jgi:hypothetical protein
VPAADKYGVETIQGSREDDMTQSLSEKPSGTTEAGRWAEEFCLALGEKIPALRGERERGIVEDWFAERIAVGRFVEQARRKASGP